MNVILIEDEPPGLEQLRNYLLELAPETQVLAEVRTLAEGRRKKADFARADLIISDIHLTDGLSFELLTQAPAGTPVVFITAFDHYLLKAFEFHSVDYLLKPLRKKDLQRALDKYELVKGRFSADLTALFQQIKQGSETPQRLIVKKGTSYYPVEESEVAYFFTEHKVVFLVNHQGERFLLDQNLTELEDQLPNSRFFRLNRKYMAAAKAVKRFHSEGKGKLGVELFPSTGETVVVSQERAGAFKNWLAQSH